MARSNQLKSSGSPNYINFWAMVATCHDNKMPGIETQCGDLENVFEEGQEGKLWE